MSSHLFFILSDTIYSMAEIGVQKQELELIRNEIESRNNSKITKRAAKKQPEEHNFHLGINQSNNLFRSSFNTQAT